MPPLTKVNLRWRGSDEKSRVIFAWVVVVPSECARRRFSVFPKQARGRCAKARADPRQVHSSPLRHDGDREGYQSYVKRHVYKHELENERTCRTLRKGPEQTVDAPYG